MPYIKQKMRDIVDPHIKKLFEKFLREEDISPSRIGNIFNIIATYSNQGHIPQINRHLYTPSDTIICKNLIQAIIELPRDALYGILNYCITRFLILFIGDKIRYNKIQAAMEAITEAQQYVNAKSLKAMLICAGNEFYRRVAVPYEDSKAKENGDVY